MATLEKLEGLDHYRLTDIKEDEVIDCPDNITQISKVEGNGIKIVLKKGKILGKI